MTVCGHPSIRFSVFRRDLLIIDDLELYVCREVADGQRVAVPASDDRYEIDVLREKVRDLYVRRCVYLFLVEVVVADIYERKWGIVAQIFCFASGMVNM